MSRGIIPVFIWGIEAWRVKYKAQSHTVHGRLRNWLWLFLTLKSVLLPLSHTCPRQNGLGTVINKHVALASQSALS